MTFNSAYCVTCTFLAVISMNASANTISIDWKTSGDNLITQDTNTGLEWLDLTATVDRSANDIASQISVGGEFEGWRFATPSEVSDFFDAFGGFNIFYNGWSSENNGLFSRVALFWGDLRCFQIGCVEGEGQSHFLTAFNGAFFPEEQPYTPVDVRAGVIGDIVTDSRSATADLVDVIWDGDYRPDIANPTVGSALVRVTAVPIPSAVWLFGSGLLGLIGVARRKRQA